MKACAVMFFILGIIAYSANFMSPKTEVKAVALSKNFFSFRNAVASYVHTNPREALSMTHITQNHFTLPYGYTFMRPWQARIAGTKCYIFGNSSSQEVAYIFQHSKNTRLIGLSKNGVLMPSKQILPSFIPNGQLVSIIEVTP